MHTDAQMDQHDLNSEFFFRGCCIQDLVQIVTDVRLWFLIQLKWNLLARCDDIFITRPSTRNVVHHFPEGGRSVDRFLCNS
jgi:hypothetical protein